MNVAVEKLPHCLATLQIEVEPERVIARIEEVTKQYSKAVKLPGYRPGKVPRAIVEKRFKKEIKEETERQLLGDATREAIQNEKLRAISVTNYEDVELGEDRSLKFTATVVTQPEFELPSYKGLVVAMRPTDVTEAEVDSFLEELREQEADFVDAEVEAAGMGDYVVVDYSGAIEGKPVHEVFPKAGRPLTGNTDFWIKMTEEAFFPGYCAALVGMKIGETRKFSVEVPADFPVEGMPGKQIDYEVTLKGIKHKVLPPLDDALAKRLSPNVPDITLESLRKQVHARLVTLKREQAEKGKRDDLVRQLLAAVECELPQELVRAQARSALQEIVRENQERGVTEDVLRENESELVGAASASARDRLKTTFVLLRIAEAENIHVRREELVARVFSLAERYEMSFDKMLKELERRNGMDQIKEELLKSKVLDFLAANASVTTVPAA